MNKDITTARSDLLKIIGPIEVTPGNKGNMKFVTLKSKANLSGLLGLGQIISKNKNSGERI